MVKCPIAAKIYNKTIFIKEKVSISDLIKIRLE